MKRTLAAAAALIILAGCSHATATTPTPTGGGDFLPAYLDTITGKRHHRDLCETHTLEQLLLPCDAGR